MIDWQVQIDGQYPEGWNPRNDGCWSPDFDHQEYLLPIFNVGDVPIDPFEGATFDAPALRRLGVHLEHARELFEARTLPWTVTEASPERTTTLRLDPKKVLATIDRTLEMIELALAKGGVIVFGGD